MVTQLELGDIAVDVVRKNIKHVHLCVYPPTGRVRISAPSRMSLDTIRVFAVSKLDWIKRQQSRLRDQTRETAREYVDRESHYVWGKRYLLRVVEAAAPARAELRFDEMVLHVRPGAPRERREAVVGQWYREQIKAAVPALIVKWELETGVKVAEWRIKRMKTRWGTCNLRARRIWLNLELARKPASCLEYIVVHEMVHLLERRHNNRFRAYMDRFMPQWRVQRALLNRTPQRHREWLY